MRICVRQVLKSLHHLEVLPKEVMRQLQHDFSLRVRDGIFNGIHTDQFIETTYMRLGHGPGGARGLTINQKQIEVWALSFATTGELVKKTNGYDSRSIR